MSYLSGPATLGDTNAEILYQQNYDHHSALYQQHQQMYQAQQQQPEVLVVEVPSGMGAEQQYYQQSQGYTVDAPVGNECEWEGYVLAAKVKRTSGQAVGRRHADAWVGIPTRGSNRAR